MKLSVPANYDPDLAPRLAQFPVDEVYGKYPSDVVGGGRPSYMGTPLREKRLRTYVARLAEHGIAFNYLLNSACLGNREWSRGWQRGLDRLLGRLASIGIGRLTISTPYLLEAVKARFPQFKVKVGIFAQVDTPRRARFWEELGADAITLESFSINRDLDRLRAIRKSVTCDLQLIANHPCLPNCGYQPYHQNCFAHASNGSDRLFIDYCFLSCTERRIANPSLFIKAGWIRPEDLAGYEALGFHTFKLLERGMPSGELLKRVQAYSSRKFEGNLAELILPYNFREPPRLQQWWGLRHFFRPWQANPLKLKDLLELARVQGMLFAGKGTPITIDSSRIPSDFLDAVSKRDCLNNDCSTCGYCDRIAATAVRIDPSFQSQVLSRSTRFMKELLNGKLWNNSTTRQPRPDAHIPSAGP
jgi:collagenase-like PrtC family protease